VKRELNSEEIEIANAIHRQMLAIGELLKKPSSDKDEVKQFRVRIAKDQKEMKRHLQQRLQQACVTIYCTAR
jgi:hypothetical protein